ncbi:MAG: HU family DNA-binding protein [Phycisphaerae bacterium]
MTKRDIVQRIAASLEVDQVLTRRVVQGFLDSVIHTLLESGRLELRDFGVFEVKLRAARKARNPKTNQEVRVPPRRVLTFQAGKNVAQQFRSVHRG